MIILHSKKSKAALVGHHVFLAQVRLIVQLLHMQLIISLNGVSMPNTQILTSLDDVTKHASSFA